MHQQVYKLNHDPPVLDEEFCSYPNPTPSTETEVRDDVNYPVKLHYSCSQDEEMLESFPNVDLFDNSDGKLAGAVKPEIGTTKVFQESEKQSDLNSHENHFIETNMSEHPEILLAIESIPAKRVTARISILEDGQSSLPAINMGTETISLGDPDSQECSFLVVDSQAPLPEFEYDPTLLVPSTIPKKTEEISDLILTAENESLCIQDSLDAVPQHELENLNPQLPFKSPLKGKSLKESSVAPYLLADLSQKDSQFLEPTQPIGSVDPELTQWPANDVDILLLQRNIQQKDNEHVISSSQNQQCSNISVEGVEPHQGDIVISSQIQIEEEVDHNSAKPTSTPDQEVLPLSPGPEPNTSINENDLQLSVSQMCSIQRVDPNISVDQSQDLSAEPRSNFLPELNSQNLELNQANMELMRPARNDGGHEPSLIELHGDKENEKDDFGQSGGLRSDIGDSFNMFDDTIILSGMRSSTLKRKKIVDSSDSSDVDDSGDDDYKPSQKALLKNETNENVKKTKTSSAPKKKFKIRNIRIDDPNTTTIVSWQLFKDNLYSCSSNSFKLGEVPADLILADVRCGQQYLLKKNYQLVTIEEILIPNDSFRIKGKRGKLVKVQISDLLYNPELNRGDNATIEPNTSTKCLDMSHYGFIISTSSKVEPQEKWFTDKDFVKSKITEMGGKLFNGVHHIFDKRRKRFQFPQNIVLLSHKPLRTKKFLAALAVGIPIVSTLWIRDCIERVLEFN